MSSTDGIHASQIFYRGPFLHDEKELTILQASDDHLIKAVRSLDQSTVESIPDTLSTLWTLLTRSISGPFHASEELVLRWLLKNMNGGAETAERFRRYALAWNIMACVFKRIPLPSLAKSLADRRFVPILQQTLVDVSKPHDDHSNTHDASSDVEMVDAGSASPARTTKKRKRSLHTQFDLGTLKTSRGCLATADALFGAIQALIERLDSVDEDLTPSVQMGAEHVKSLFSSPAKHAVELLRPILSVCDLVLQEQDLESCENQASWVSVFASLWDFHLQSNTDAHEVAVSLYPAGCILLAKMDRSKDLVLDVHVKASWTRDLRRFFIKNMILPARAAFLNLKNIDIIKAAVDVTNFMPTASCPVLFDLATKTPHYAEDASARKNHEDWTQKVFEVIEEPIRQAEPAKRSQATRVILDTALRTGASISLSGLRLVCSQHTTASKKMDLGLVTRAANLDVDAFLISNEGHALLDEVIKQISQPDDDELQADNDSDPVQLIILLARGFAKSRNLSGFFKTWYEALAQCSQNGAEQSAVMELWSSTALVTSVASLLQSSVNIKQLLAMFDWLDEQDAASKPDALLVVLDAVSQGITDEAFVDAIDLRLHHLAAKLNLKTLRNSAKLRWWHIVGSIATRATLEQFNIIWDTVVNDLKKELKKGDIASPTTFAAFDCCNRFWLANYPGGPHATEAAAMAKTFLKRLEKHTSTNTPATKSDSLNTLSMPCRLGLLAQSDFGAKYLKNHFQRMVAYDVSGDAVGSIIHNEFDINVNTYVRALTGHAVDSLKFDEKEEAAENMKRVIAGAQILHSVPLETLNREKRECIMSQAIILVKNWQTQDVAWPGELIETTLALMIKVMRRPTFYENMKFADLVCVGDSIVASLTDSPEKAKNLEPALSYTILKLFEALAAATFQQMTSNLDKRDRAYLEEASSVIAAWPCQLVETQPHRLILARSLVLALESPKAHRQVRAVVDPAIIRKHASHMIGNFMAAQSAPGGSTIATWLGQNSLSGFKFLILEQLDVMEPRSIRDHLSASLPEIERLCNLLCDRGARAGWRLRELIMLCCGDNIEEPLSLGAENPLHSSNEDRLVSSCLRADVNDLNRYIDVVLRSMSEERRNSYFANFSRKLRDSSDLIGHVLAIYRLLHAEIGQYSGHICSLLPKGFKADIEIDPALQACLDSIDLAEVHSVLANRLAQSRSCIEFSLLSQTMYALLDKKPSAMKQWNTEVTLSTVSTLYSYNNKMSGDVARSPKTYEHLCRLVEIIIKRHRVRIEGHFHLLVTALQSLLHLLIGTSSTTTPHAPNGNFDLQGKQAKLFARLLTLVCEPSVASVTRGQQTGLLDSATDAAKRSAGQHMYLVLMFYIKLQLEHAVPQVVREALQPGMYSILDITTQEGRRILNEAVDGSGRAIFREMYRRYVKFGKWSGI